LRTGRKVLFGFASTKLITAITFGRLITAITFGRSIHSAETAKGTTALSSMLISHRA
jgi:hypothetical protein